MIPVPKRQGGGKVHPSQARSKVQEAETAARLGGRVTKQSGGGMFEKGDVRIPGLVKVECKTTKNKSFSVTKDIIEKIEEQALGAGELPVIEVDILNGEHGCYVMPKWALESLLGMVKT